MSIRREVYTAVCDSVKKSSYKSGDQRLEFDIHDDFKLVYTFYFSNINPAELIPLDLFDVIIDYYIDGKPETYQVVKRGLTHINCVVIDDKSTIKAIFDNHKLGVGDLHAKFTFQFPDEDYPNKYANSIVVVDTGITLINK